jgi:hypothetical protein
LGSVQCVFVHQGIDDRQYLARARILERHVPGCAGCSQGEAVVFDRLLDTEAGRGPGGGQHGHAKTGPREDLAYRFINFMLEGKNSAELSNMLGSGNPNVAAMPFIDPEVKDNPAVFPDAAAMKRLEQLRDLPRKERRLMNRMWTEIKVR